MSSSLPVSGCAPVAPSSLLVASPADRSALYHKPAYTAISTELQAALCTAYLDQSAGESFDHSAQLSGGLSNSNYRWATNLRRYLCKICNEKPLEELRRHMTALDRLRSLMDQRYPNPSDRLPIAFPVPMFHILPSSAADSDPAADRFILRHGSLNVIFYQFLSGSNPSEATPAIVSAIAHGLAKLHLVSSGRSEFESWLGHNQFPLGQIEPIIKDIQSGKLSPAFMEKHAEYLNYLQSEYAYLKPFLDGLQDPAQYPYSLNHGDLFLENVMFTFPNQTGNEKAGEPQLSGFIDFEEMFYGPRILDLAMTTVGCLFNSQDELDYSLLNLFLSEYNSMYPLTPLEWQSFPLALRYCLIGISIWFFQLFHQRTEETEPVRLQAHLPPVRQIALLNIDKMKLGTQ